MLKPAILSALLALAIAPSVAQAEPTGPSVGLDFLYGRTNNTLAAFIGGGNDITLIGMALHGHLSVTSDLLIGGRIPLAHAQLNDDSASSIGNLTFELNYRLTQRARSQSWLDSSLSLATADDDGDGAIAALSFADFWMPDPGLYAPNTSTVRLMYRHALGDPALGAEFQAGFQYLAIDGPDDLMRVPLRIGGHVELGDTVAAIGRFSTYWQVNAEDGDDSFLHMLEAGLNLRRVGRGKLDIILYYPLDDLYREDLEAWGLQLGFSSAI